MDPISLSTLVTLITQSAAGEAGKSAWEGLGALARRALRHEQHPDAALRAAKDAGPAGALDLAGHLLQSAADDPELAVQLRAWISKTQQIAATGGAVVNTISGQARVRDAVQARDVGVIYFGSGRENPAKEAREEAKLFDERIGAAAAQLASEQHTVKLAGVYAMARLADDWDTGRQTCINFLCANVRRGYVPRPADDANPAEHLAFADNQEFRHTIIAVISARLRNPESPWQRCNFDFHDTVFDGGDFQDVTFSSGVVSFKNATFAGGKVSFANSTFSRGSVVDFTHATFSGGLVNFYGAKFCGGQVSFYNATFVGGKVSFPRAEFTGGMLDFLGATFSGGTVDLRDPANASVRPLISGFTTDNPAPAGVLISVGRWDCPASARRPTSSGWLFD